MPKYIVSALEHVYDAFDEYEHSNKVQPIMIEAASVEEAAMNGRMLFQEKLDEQRRLGGFMSSGSFVIEIKSIDEVNGQNEGEIVTDLPPWEFQGLSTAGVKRNEKRSQVNTDTSIGKQNQHNPPLLKVFICHASEDKPTARELFYRLKNQGIDPWLDTESLLPGQDWDLEIKKTVRESHVVIVCLSPRSITKEGYVQKEIRIILDIADEKPDGTIFVIPIMLDECKIPTRLARWQCVRLDEAGFAKMLRSLEVRASEIISKS